ncbi:MAG TPA: hypothetical protein ENF95_00210 [Candidatus Aenigmarchaeota archaeon]|nr:hypothetical protein [Candidatus Aenigmarchaeota archaeon]
MGLEIVIGLMEGAITTASFLPQVIKIWKTKSTRDLSLGMFIFISLGMGLWIVYGLLINSLPVIVANLVSLALCLTIIAFKIKYK